PPPVRGLRRLGPGAARRGAARRRVDRGRFPDRGRVRGRTGRAVARCPAPPGRPHRVDGELPRRAGEQLMDADHLAAGAATRSLDARGERRVAPAADAVGRLAELGGTLPDEPSDPAEVVRLLDEIAGPATVASAGGRYFGFVTGSTLPAARAAAHLVS